jgi:hypothetical protein
VSGTPDTEPIGAEFGEEAIEQRAEEHRGRGILGSR